GEEEPPVAEAGHVHVVGGGVQSGFLHALSDTPVGAGGEVRRPGLDDDPRFFRHSLPDQSVELHRIQFGGVDVVGVGEVHDDRVELLGGGPQPGERVVVDDGDAFVGERIPVERGDAGVGASQVNYGRVEVDEDNACHVRVFEDFAQGQAVPAAEDEHGAARPVHHRVDERLVVAVLVQGGELEVAVEEQPKVGAGEV